METRLAAEFAGTREGTEAEAILRACVHCGFCTATCPTYQLLGDELDGPRGRIYLIKEVLEGATPTTRTQLHLDRCLTCRSCETTCPSGVRYGALVDIGRRIVERKVGRSPAEAAQRYSLRKGLMAKPLFGAALTMGRMAKSWLPREIARRIPDAQAAGTWPAPRHARRMLVMQGCVQPAIAPNIDAAMARVLDRVGVSAVRAPVGGGCCGALSEHLAAHDESLALARRNIDAWWPAVEAGTEAIVVTASGCGVMVRDYGHLLAEDPAYAVRAARIAAIARDPAEVVADLWGEIGPKIAMDRGALRVAFQAPCTLQHGMRIRGQVEELIDAMGHQRLPVADAHLCCGSAGTYSILQPALAGALKQNKLAALEVERPHVIASANIGCITHLASGTTRPVRHWIELLDERMLGAVKG
ncbi:MAG TPA: glycolate oxidase subunit GlcF [Casimicrobiaceae bacterium]|nr:glycolate oxidase subunit GlcF [Casimicrobiaceae bacterium]